MLPMLHRPPVFDSAFWPSEHKPPYHAPRITFSFGDFAEFVRFDEDQCVVFIMGVKTEALNLQLETPAEEPNYPLYFEVTGRLYHYIFSVWSDRVTIEVCRKAKDRQGTYPVLSVMFPSTANQLRAALETIRSDLN